MKIDIAIRRCECCGQVMPNEWQKLKLPPIPRKIIESIIKSGPRTVEQLANDIWGYEEPESYIKCVHVHVHRLNKILKVHNIAVRAPIGRQMDARYSIRQLT